MTPGPGTSVVQVITVPIAMILVTPIDFVGWYGNMSNKQNGLPKTTRFDSIWPITKGMGATRRSRIKVKAGWVDVARKVDRQANTYNSQLKGCVQELDQEKWWKLW